MLTPGANADDAAQDCRPGSSKTTAILSHATLSEQGWRLFDGFDALEGSATHSNPRNAMISGLSYNLSTIDPHTLMLRLDAWRFNKRGETTALTVMELQFNAAGYAAPVNALTGLKIMARPSAINAQIAKQAIAAALFLMGQIRLGHVPDYERVLELHRLHPGLMRGGVNDRA